jgi:hypothetical protein
MAKTKTPSKPTSRYLGVGNEGHNVVPNALPKRPPPKKK